MNARDELARDIFVADNSNHPDAAAEWEDPDLTTPIAYAYDIADGLIAAGYVKEASK